MLKTISYLGVATLIVACAISSQAFAEGLSVEEALGGKDCGKGDGKGGGTCGASDGFCIDAFIAGDGWHTKSDDDDGNNNFGYRTGLNSSVGLWRGIHGQFGASVGGYNLYGRAEGPEKATEVQFFLTAGAFKRADPCCGERISWSVVWDYMNDNYFGEDGDDVALNQLRYLGGYALNDSNELGIWGTIRADDYRGDYHGINTAEAISQVNIYWRRQWERGGETMLYTGPAFDRVDMAQWTIGFNGRVPLSYNMSLFGGAHFVIPSTSPGDVDPNGVDDSFTEQTWNITFGFIYSFGPGGCNSLNTPLLPVADNGWFSVTDDSLN